ncbi:ANTAR domain-containing response regulator [Magnetospira sp. QH-2]|uniref:ANTAR domain-containing response regulator n=1 Tax=Magnetospira sp. (strain QH-2) TaxID=1288970 RepID=UPI0005F9C69E|nr:ANTAR domain-containing protein [Magnetospira sp. QH-2]
MNVLLCAKGEERGAQLEKVLLDAGYGLAVRLDDPAKVIEMIQTTEPDLLVFAHPKPAEPEFKVISDIRATLPRPILMFSEDGTTATMRAAVAAGVNSYVLVGVNANRVHSAIDLAFAHYSEAQELRGELAKATTALAERKMIERAKGIIMKTKALDEEEAYAFMRSTAMNRDMRLAALAKTVIEAHELVN